VFLWPEGPDLHNRGSTTHGRTSSPPLPETKFGLSQRQDNTEMSCLPGRCHIYTIYRGSMTHGYEDSALRATERKAGALPFIRRRLEPTPSGASKTPPPTDGYNGRHPKTRHCPTPVGVCAL
jgi:hypothetical protein